MEDPKDPLKKGITPIRSKVTAGGVEAVGCAAAGPMPRNKTKARANPRVLLSPAGIIFSIGRPLLER
jgi:hypothetical protein